MVQRILTIAGLTWKAAFRFRVFWVLAVLLMGSVIVLPLILKDDQSARGFIQIMLTYTLGVITTLLGMATLWIACGTLARDVDDCSMQMVAVKPIGRWEIWVGKWLGIMAVNALLLVLAGTCVYGLILWRARQLSPAQQEILRNEVMVARGSLREPLPDIEQQTDQVLKDRLKDVVPSGVNLRQVRATVREQVKAYNQVVPPNRLRRWQIPLGLRKDLLRDLPMTLRLKFYAISTNGAGTYAGVIEVGPPDSPQRRSLTARLASDTHHELSIPPNLWDDHGVLTVDFQNRDTVSLLVPLEDGLEVLYREGGFGWNFARGLGIIFCWLALLTTVGLSASSFLSFPVAAFCSVSLLLVGFSTGSLSYAIEYGSVMGMNEESGASAHSALDLVLIPLFKALVGVFSLTQSFSPVDSLSTGRSITWGELGRAFAQIVLVLGGPIALAGIWLFTRRELATAQNNS